MYRHLTFKENFTDYCEEVHHQRNVALGHVEHHRLVGIVHFMSAANVYDLRFFQEIRDIETFGATQLEMNSLLLAALIAAAAAATKIAAFDVPTIAFDEGYSPLFKWGRDLGI